LVVKIINYRRQTERETLPFFERFLEITI